MAPSSLIAAENLRLSELFVRANDLNKTGKTGQSLKLLKQSSDGGWRRAQTLLGAMYESGTKDCKQDFKKANKLYELAAAKREEGRIDAGEGLSDAQFRLGRSFAEGRGVKKDKEQATIWLWKAANQKHPRAEAYIAELNKKGSMKSGVMFFAKKMLGVRSSRKTLTPDQTPIFPAEEALPKVEEAVTKISPEASKSNAERASLAVASMQDEAKRLAAEERSRKREKAEEMRGQLIDVTFDTAKLDLSMVLATDHETQRKMIIVDKTPVKGAAVSLLQAQDELVAVGDDFDLPVHVLTFAELDKLINARPRPLTMTFARLHEHRPDAKDVTHLGGIVPPALKKTPAEPSTPDTEEHRLAPSSPARSVADEMDDFFQEMDRGADAPPPPPPSQSSTPMVTKTEDLDTLLATAASVVAKTQPVVPKGTRPVSTSRQVEL